jgi:hypothetical protein
MDPITGITIVAVLLVGMSTYMTFQDQIHNLFTKRKN